MNRDGQAVLFCKVTQRVLEAKSLEELEQIGAGLLYPLNGKWLYPSDAINSSHRSSLISQIKARKADFRRVQHETKLALLESIAKEPNFETLAPLIDVIEARSILKLRKERGVVLNNKVFSYLMKAANPAANAA